MLQTDEHFDDNKDLTKAERVRVQMSVFRTRLLANMPAAEVDATKLRALNGVTEELRRAGVPDEG